MRFQIALGKINMLNGERYLDYGSGDGAIVKADPKVFQAYKNVTLYEPLLLDTLIENLKGGEYSGMEVVSEIPNEKFDTVTALEVLEHFEEPELGLRLNELLNLLTPEANLIISVPIEVGINGMLKNILRFCLRQCHENTSLINFCLAVIDGKIIRYKSKSGYIHSHVGFSHKKLEKTLKEYGLNIVSKDYSPFKNGILQLFRSQVIYTCKLR